VNAQDGTGDGHEIITYSCRLSPGFSAKRQKERQKGPGLELSGLSNRSILELIIQDLTSYFTRKVNYGPMARGKTARR
jgi:hypothetical protein